MRIQILVISIALAFVVRPLSEASAYRSLTPKRQECGNLFIPVCMVASHVALSFIRMEPTYMIMGESAGIAAARAIEEAVDVQDIDMAAYRTALLEAGQVLEWDGTGYSRAFRNKPWWSSHPEDYERPPIAAFVKAPRKKQSDTDTGRNQ